MKKLALVSAISLAASGQVIAAGYKLPENSINGTALSAAYVANAHGADAAYYNPAAMVFNESGASLEANLTAIHLTSMDYSGAGGSDSSKKENFLIPSFHYVSPEMGNARFGLSVVTPAGLTKRWSGLGASTAEEFTLKTVEINPTAAYKINDQFSVAAGARVIYSMGVVKSGLPAAGFRDMDGDSFDFGYNLALLFKPTDVLSLAATYRSKIDLTVSGDARIGFTAGPTTMYNGDVSVLVPVPAALNLAAAYDVTPDTTVELVFERTYWSAYDQLDFNYSVNLATIHAGLAAFDNPSIKNWSDSDTYRIGISHKLNNKWDLMAGFAYDKTPIDNKYLGFELPDTDAKIFSLGAKYKYSDKMTIGGAFLYDKKDELSLTPADGNTGTGGAFSTATVKDAAAYLLTVGLEYKF
ncbi:OmpP1/FadL family transporter [Sedimenticola selenatireducens]|uniref:Transporter n=1 Tax=Sedimenticola selenatireducens TaxID=191960 RepID=A0A557SFT1_9GAMM|nr:OmpP1/FadL family transporter [Sedimenticola selenatireducens]TVO76287.1 transporter [Sedimenticola selenatireducens]TVT61397.1 MAG: transporter [Sedimenticola selenatireducens]